MAAPGLIGAHPGADSPPRTGAVDLYWLPLGAGGRFVRLNGRAFEAVTARAEGRPPCRLYHSALEVHVGADRFVIEQAPALGERGEERGVVIEGPVGARWAGQFRILRYEIRRWRDGQIPDVGEAVGSPVGLTVDGALARRVFDLVPQVPPLTWGRDELGAGEMWNSNSIIAWLLTCGGIDARSIQPPPGGRAPGWRAGIEAAAQGRCVTMTRDASAHAADS